MMTNELELLVVYNSSTQYKLWQCTQVRIAVSKGVLYLKLQNYSPPQHKLCSTADNDGIMTLGIFRIIRACR